MGGYKSLYLSDDEKNFADKYLNNFNDWVKEKLHEEMEHTCDYCSNKVNLYSEKLEKWEKRKEQAIKEKKKQNDTYSTLVAEYTKRQDAKTGKGFLEGKRGQKLLADARMNISRFINSLDKEEGDNNKNK